MSGGAAPSAAPAAHLPALDGIRCLGFLLVFAHHAGPRGAPVLGPVFANLWGGVDVFFTLSGFLVTWILLREEARNERATGAARFSLVRFWVRRSLRIWPLYFAALALFVFVLPHLPWDWRVGPVAGTPRADQLRDVYLLPAGAFLLNWATAAHGWPDGPIGPLWSVSVEEQFYVLWPLLLFAAPRAWRRGVIVAVVVVATALKVRLLAAGAPYQEHYVSTFARADAFVVGAWIALAWAEGRRFVARPWLGPAVAAAGAALLALPSVTERGLASGMAGYLLLSAFSAGLLVLALDPATRTARALASRPATYLGRISYGLYVFHHGAISLADRVIENCGVAGHGIPHYALRTALAFAITLAVALLSWHLWEKWFLRLKERFA